MRSMDKRTPLERLQHAAEQDRTTHLNRHDIKAIWSEILRLRCLVAEAMGQTAPIDDEPGIELGAPPSNLSAALAATAELDEEVW